MNRNRTLRIFLCALLVAAGCAGCENKYGDDPRLDGLEPLVKPTAPPSHAEGHDASHASH